MFKAGPLALMMGALIAAAPFAYAQDTNQSQSPILILDQERLYQGSRVAERISAEIERRTQELSDENRQIEADLTAQELDLTERRPTLDPVEFRALADAFDEKVQTIRATQDEKARDLQRLQEQEQQNFLRRITPVLGEIVRERRAVVVLDRRTVFLSAETIDITDEAIARINAALDATPSPTQTPVPSPSPEAPAPAEPPLDAPVEVPLGSPPEAEDP